MIDRRTSLAHLFVLLENCAFKFFFDTHIHICQWEIEVWAGFVIGLIDCMENETVRLVTSSFVSDRVSVLAIPDSPRWLRRNAVRCMSIILWSPGE